MPSVKELTLYSECGIAHFYAALDAGMATVTRLSVFFTHLEDENETAKKLEYLTRMIRGAVQLNSLNIHKHNSRYPLNPPRQLFEALEACASVTEIRNDDERHDFTGPEVQQQLRQITARNSNLGQFVANPSTFPNAKLLTLMRQFNDCPSGLYLLTRRLPEAFSFQKGSSLFPLTVNPNSTKQLRKRRKISYKE